MKASLSYLLSLNVVDVTQPGAERVSQHHPLLLHQGLEPCDGSVVGIHQHLGQTGDHTAHVVPVPFCNTRDNGNALKKETMLSISGTFLSYPFLSD